MRVNSARFLLSIVMMLSSVFIFGQQATTKKDTLPAIKIVGDVKIYSVDQSFNEQLKNSTYFMKNNDVNYKTTKGKIDSLFGASIESKNRAMNSKKTNSKKIAENF